MKNQIVRHPAGGIAPRRPPPAMLSFALLAASVVAAAAISSADPHRRLYTTEAEFLSNHTAHEVQAIDARREIAKRRWQYHDASDRARLKDVAHFCTSSNPCTITTSPCYVNWDYVVVNTTFVNATSIINIAIANGNADVAIGPLPEASFSSCCGPDGATDCQWYGVTGTKYGGTCTSQGLYTVVSLWNHNYVESEYVTLTFNDGVGPGPD